MWKRLAHPNVVPLLCITVSPFQLISDWMSGGNVVEYLEKNPNTDIVQLVGFRAVALILRSYPLQLHDAAEGLYYLHSCSVIHGNLKGVRSRYDHIIHPILTLARRTSS